MWQMKCTDQGYPENEHGKREKIALNEEEMPNIIVWIVD